MAALDYLRYSPRIELLQSLPYFLLFASFRIVVKPDDAGLEAQDAVEIGFRWPVSSGAPLAWEKAGGRAHSNN
jgi:hypothetical protein